MKIIVALCVVMFVSVELYAQDYRLDVNLRGSSIAKLDFGDQEVQTDGFETSWINPDLEGSMEVLFYPKSFIGIGVYYGRSFIPGSNEYYRQTENTSFPGYYDGNAEYSDFKYAMYGATLQLTTSRQKFLRVYGVLRAGKYELVEQFRDFSVSGSGFAYSGGFGVMMKLTRRLSFNLLEAN